ncbi:electron transport complex protein RnfG [Thiohalospira halophila DSM 15071]|uniref:Ion-translocating oxidoreductase complex subunit G n=1 Tax=Thiohalospira halophila DSM 15071 TaxID=1123397 RepID=A0A1I1Q8X6_9GAMM|nr:electron transport complex subunit RsxG [Thiohalospira halophila]SFD18561.1 electron transport complex protein RnfG [Thiohalospira halophila DSM 15071]
MTANLRHIALAGGILALFALIGTGLVALTHEATDERIAANQRAATLETLHELIPESRYDNDPVRDAITVTAPQALGSKHPLTVYRARRNGEPVAAVLTVVAPDGYGGPIRLLVAIDHDGTLAGVRVVNHSETPGLGDAIEIERSDWIEDFAGRSLGNPPREDWRVEKDGGVFDQFTGATITPRAVVAAVRRALIYFEEHRRELFARGESAEEP